VLVFGETERADGEEEEDEEVVVVGLDETGSEVMGSSV